MDRITITDLLVRTIIGINDEERLKQQDVLISITLWADLEKAGKSDRLDDTVNYRSIKNRIYAMAEQSRYGLLEALAEKTAALCLENDKVQRVRVNVEKPGALRFAKCVGVEITRERGSG